MIPANTGKTLGIGDQQGPSGALSPRSFLPHQCSGSKLHMLSKNFSFSSCWIKILFETTVSLRGGPSYGNNDSFLRLRSCAVVDPHCGRRQMPP